MTEVAVDELSLYQVRQMFALLLVKIAGQEVVVPITWGLIYTIAIAREVIAIIVNIVRNY